MNYEDFDVVVPTHRKEKALKIIEDLKPIKVRHFDGTGYNSFSKLVNHVIISSDKEQIIWVSDKMVIKPVEVEKMMNLMNDKFSLVCFHNFNFFGFKKQLIREVGFWDERFVGGEMSDCDFLRRVKLKNLAVYMSFESYKIQEGSSWHGGNVYAFYKQKWLETDVCDYKLLPEETYKYDLGQSIECNWGTWEQSVYPEEHVKFYKLKKIESN